MIREAVATAAPIIEASCLPSHKYKIARIINHRIGKKQNFSNIVFTRVFFCILEVVKQTTTIEISDIPGYLGSIY